MKKLKLGPGLALPAEEAQTSTSVVYGGKGMGKTNFLVVLLEELARARLRFSWIDPVGVAWGLKHSADGDGAGVEVLILGGIHGDVPIEPTAGAVVADLVVDEKPSVIIDISRRADGRMWSAGEKIRVIRDYCVRLFERQGERRRPLMQVIDEAGRFVPQQMPKGAIDIAECVGAIEQLVELGRNVGVGVCLVTQRSARMNKSVSELADMMVAFRTVGPRSIDAIVDWFGEHIPKERWRELVEAIRKLPVGTALVVSPGWLELEGEYAIRARETFDSSATPKAGQERRASGRGAQVDVAKYRTLMAETVERAEANDPRALHRKVRELEAQLKKRPTERAVEKPVEVPVEVPVPIVDVAHLEEIRTLGQELIDTTRAQLQETSASLGEGWDQITRLVREAEKRTAEGAKEAGPKRPAARAADAPSMPAARPAAGSPTREGTVGPAADTLPGPTSRSGGFELKGPHRKVLNAVAWWQELVGIPQPTKIQVAYVAGYRVKKKVGGHFGNILGDLKREGLIDYPSPGTVVVTPEGSSSVLLANVAPTTEALQAAILQQLTGPERKILEVLIEAYPDPLLKQELGARSGYQVGEKVGGHFGNVLGSLKGLQLIDYPTPGQAVASSVLFLEEPT